MQRSDRPRTADGRRRVEKRSAVGGLWSNKGNMEEGEKEKGFYISSELNEQDEQEKQDKINIEIVRFVSFVRCRKRGMERGEIKRQEARGKKQEARSKKQETRNKKQEARGKKQEIRTKKQEVFQSNVFFLNLES